MEQSAVRLTEPTNLQDDVFKEVQTTNIPKVLQALKKEWPKHFLLHQIITILEEYKKAGTKWKHTLYVSGDYDTGVYLNKVLVEFPNGRNYLYAYVYTANSDLTELKASLLKTQLVPWESRGYLFQMIHNRFLRVIQEVFEAKGMGCEVHNNTMFWFPPDKDLQIQPLPDDVYIDFLNKSYAVEMDKNWPHRFPGSEFAHQEHLEKHFGMGLFRKSDGKLMSSALSNYTGGIFVLYTCEEGRGRGYAGALVHHIVRELRHRGRVPFCTVIIGNKPSESVFTRAGFEVFIYADYIFPKINQS